VATPPFWQTLLQHSGTFRQRLVHVVRHALASTGRAFPVPLEPGSPVQCFGIPLRYRERADGVVIACALGDDFRDEEARHRFCARHAVDRFVMERLAADLQLHPVATLASYAQIMQDQVSSHGVGSIARRDIDTLSAHLAQTYEELNLIYRVSTDLTVLKRPADHFRKLGEELVTSTMVNRFATVLEREVEAASGPVVVTAGPVDASYEDLVRLYVTAEEVSREAGALVVNNVAADPRFAWAASWLRQFIFVSLAHREHVFGGFLALSRVDGQEFGSEEMQLINTVAQRSTAFLENVRLYEDLEQLFMGMLHALVSSIDAKDPYTCGHSQRVAFLSRYIARLTGATEEQAERAYLSGLLHDIGKIGITEAVLCKTGRLTDEEFAEMKRHPDIGARILQNMRQIEDVMPGVRYHHERYDGKGYPYGLRGAEIPLLGRIVGLADSFDAMTTSRVYRRAHPIQLALAEIRRYAGTQFDPQLVELLVREDLSDLLRQLKQAENAPIHRFEPSTAACQRELCS
jgi:HD-GYP domain-containing protein (c-di-GMP phosphodiesterase class II)